ncbi:hypothetical protein OY671_008397, partial [Metschnikowia pulcherrima]
CLAVLVFDTYGQYHPLRRQAERFACEGASLSVLTSADQIGTACHALMRIYRMIEAHVLVPSAFMAMTPPRGEKASIIHPIASEVVPKLDASFAIERDINGKNPAERLAVRRELARSSLKSPATTMSPKPSSTYCAAGTR